MSIYAIPPLLGALAFASLGLFVFLHPPHTKEKRIFSVLFIETFIWQIIWFISFFTKKPSHIDFLAKFAYLGITFLPFTFYHFIAEILKVKTEIYLLRFFYVIAFCLVLLIFPTNLFVAGYRPFSWGNFAAAGPLYPVFMISALVAMVRGCYILFKAKRHPEDYPISKNHIHYLILGLFPYFLCTLDFPQVFGFKLYPVGTLFFLISFSIITYAITRHHLLDIEIIIKKTLQLAGFLIMVLGVVNVVTAIMQNYIGKIFPVDPFWAMVVSGFFIILLHDPTKNLLIHITDKFLFQKKKDFPLVLSQLADEIATMLDPNKVAQLVLSTLVSAMRLETAVLFVKNKSDARYYILESHSIEGRNAAFDDSHFFVEYLAKNRRILNLEDPSMRAKIPTLALSPMDQFKTRICIPLIFQKQLMGFLLLGKKKSDQDFTMDEIKLFPAIASQTASSIKIAQLVEEVVEESKLKLEAELKAQQEAKVLNYARTMGHEIKNALVTVQGRAFEIKSYRVADLKTAYEERDDKFFHEVCGHLVEDGTVISHNGEKIKKIASTAKGTLRSDSSSFEEMYFKLMWDDAKRESGIGADKCIYESHIPEEPELFMVNCIREKLQRVFVNLITNAYEAMNGQKEKKITLRCEYKTIDEVPVCYFQLIDNGPGIPPEIRDKVFLQDFSTKSRPASTDIEASGHGQGLFVCQCNIEDIHQGKIWIESEIGKGTIFHFWIPRKQKKN